MDKENPEIAKQHANAMYDRIVARLPEAIRRREEQLFERISAINGDSFKKLRALYEFVDSLYSYVSQYIPCKKGCDHCCYYPVSITELEIRNIERALNIKRTGGKRLPNYLGVPCPFLKHGACSIYEYRPYVCRKHITLCQTATWCKVDKCDSLPLPILAFSEIQKSFEMITQENGDPGVQDIREVFGSVAQ